MNSNNKLNYMSLFSSAGIGCFGFKNNGYENVLTAELLEERINIQKINKVSVEGGYIAGDITSEEVKDKINRRLSIFNGDIDVVVATPPCQSISTLNKKTSGDIKRNSLVIESIYWVKNIKPKYFIFENVRGFAKALCEDKDSKIKKIEEAIYENLGEDYLIKIDVINFSDYGTNSSRPRTLVIGTRKDLKNTSPLMVWPNKVQGNTLRESIYSLDRFKKMGSISETNPWHFFRPYDERMRDWIKDLNEGQSAFDNKDEKLKPHKVLDGKIVVNKNKMTNKYKRMFWDKIPPCLHTRSDVLAAQYTIHPEDDRVLSIEELKRLMNIPKNFQFVKETDEKILKMPLEQKEKFIRKNELNIRRVIGEAVPYNIFESIARNIKNAEEVSNEFTEIRTINSPKTFLGKGRKFEIENSNKSTEGAYYTPQSVVFDILNSIPMNKKNGKVKILEPSVGAGNFIPQIVKLFGEENLELYVFDTNKKTINELKKNVKKHFPNLKIAYYNEDYISSDFNKEIDYIIGNPPYLTLTKDQKENYCENLNLEENSNNLITYFYHKSLKITRNIFFVLPKYFLYSTEYRSIRNILSGYIQNIYDYGIDYFDVFVETISIIARDKKSKEIKVLNRKFPELSRTINSDEMLKENIFMPYIDKTFLDLYKKTKKRNFTFMRDRQINNSHLEKSGDIWVVKSKNIFPNEILNIKNYDKYISKKIDLVQKDWIEKENVYMIPNFTYKFRIAKRPKGVATNGSVINICYEEKPDLKLMNSEEYAHYFKTIMSHSKFTLNLNIDIIKLLRW